jgi:DNA-binding CsgD family transcriptional regulator
LTKPIKPVLGIYDERILQRQMLHHNLEHMHYEILFSCSNAREFIQNFSIHPVDIILINAENGLQKAEEILQKLNSGKKKLSVLFYCGCALETEAERLKSQYHIEVFFCNGTWEDLIISLDRFTPDTKTENEPVISIAIDNPFYKIAGNKTCVRILELLREGKNIKQIAVITGIPETAVNYNLKKMRQDTGCSSVVELVIDAKETGVL